MFFHDNSKALAFKLSKKPPFLLYFSFLKAETRAKSDKKESVVFTT